MKPEAVQSSAAPNISILLPDLRPGGAERVQVVLASEWLKMGFSVEFLLVKKEGDLLDILPSETTVHALDAPRFRNAALPIARYLGTRHPDILLIAMWPLTCIAILAAKLSCFKGTIVVSDHVVFKESPETNTKFKKLLFSVSTRLTYPLAYTRIGVSKGVVEDLSALSGLHQSKFDVIYNPAAVYPQPSDLLPTPLRKRAGSRIILGVGTLKPEKDFATLLRAFAAIPAEQNIELILLGDGTERPQLEKLAWDLKIKERVTFAGTVLNTSPYYNMASVFVLSSWYEGFGNVIVEALSHGTPVVSTDCRSGPREILGDGEFGELVPVSDHIAMALAIQRKLQEEPKTDRDKLIARAMDFSPDRVAKLYLEKMGVAIDTTNVAPQQRLA